MLNFYNVLKAVISSNNHDDVIKLCREHIKSIEEELSESLDSNCSLSLTSELYYIKSIEAAALSMRIAQINYLRS